MSSLAVLQGLQAPRLMGILNVTQDSFSDGGQFLDPDKALIQAEKLLDGGAQILDIGGESTRPGSAPVPVEIELQRVIPVVRLIRERHPQAVISVDTQKSAVAQSAIEAGASLINDVSALRADAGMADVLAEHPDVGVILMHMQGEPATMQEQPRYQDVVGEICEFFEQRLMYAEASQIGRGRILLDPGIGFGKTLEHNLRILANLDQFRQFGLPLVIGASRKRFIAASDGSEPNERLGGTLAAAVTSALQNADILRVHDVQAHRQFFRILQAIAGAGD